MKKCSATKKIRYGSAVDAGVALHETHRKGHNTAAYICPHCKSWHLTHSLRPVKEDA